eukprot:Skav208703  [mRNA]  locus=scaffold42:434516:439452:- [translate_table: standard]
MHEGDPPRIFAERYGEAENPGPQKLRIGSFNPHQVLGHEETVWAWGEGIWTASETSHTITAQGISAARFKKKKLHSVWSPPVPSVRLAFLDSMVKRGWIDAAAFDADRRFSKPMPTSRGDSRKTFILMNKCLVPSLVHCDIHQTFEFDTHPLLVAELDLDTVLTPQHVWNLPASTDGCFFDDDLMSEVVMTEQHARETKFQRAIACGDANEALHQINLVFETAMQQSCVETTGHAAKLPRRCLGRCRKKLVKTQPPADPIIRGARDGEYSPQVCQPSKRIKQWTKQVRRLQTCSSQMRSLASGSHAAEGPIQALWNAICNAPGFPGGFQCFALKQMQLFVPSIPPDAEYAKYLGDRFKICLQHEVSQWNTQVHEYRLKTLRQDFQAGGSKTFRSVRDAPAPPFNAIVTLRTATIEQQRWTKGGRCKLLIADPLEFQNFDLQYPVYFQGQEAFLLEVHDKWILLDRCVINTDSGDRKLTQKHVLTGMEDLHNTTADAWGELWQREPVDDAIENWPEAIEALTCLADVPSLEYQPLNVTEWRRHAATTKQKSARGSCAYTPRELTIMPEPLVLWLLQLLTAIENGELRWPSSIMTAKVAMLGKTEDLPTHPLSLRPITITSRLYRTWAKYRSMQVFRHFHDMLPPEVAGTAAGVSADMLAAIVANEVEDSFIDGLHRVGLTVDLVKCYNMVPRLPVIAALGKLGVPRQYLTAVWDMFQQLDRIIEISGEMGNPVKSTTGIPEGCCFSIVSMLGLTAWASQFLQAHHEEVEVLAYADNWGFLTDCIERLQALLQSLQNFVTMLQMRVAPDKSWVWATHACDRRKLRHVHLQGVPVPVKLFTTDLGCDITYCKRVNKKQMRKRLGKAKRVLQKVAKRKMPKRYKLRMSNQLASSITGYGSELTYITQAEFRALRSQCCQANGRSRGGVNPYLAMNVPGDACDPELSLLVRKCRFWRRFLKAFPYRREQFFQKLTGFQDGKHSGPASVFKKTLADHGWQCLPGGTVQHTTGWQFNWYYSSKSFVTKMLTKAWHAKLCQTVQSRKHFDACNVDTAAFQHALRSLPADMKTDAINYTIGKHVTNDALGHYVSVGDFQCPLCGCADSRSHRIFECVPLQAIRERYQPVLTWLHDQPESVLHFGILPWDTTWLDFSCCEYVPMPAVQRPLDNDAGGFCHVFTDGSASFTDCFSTCVAAGAWILADGYMILQRGGSVLVGSDHSAYRGEVWALVQALQSFCKLVIYTDCAAAMSVFAALVSARESGAQPSFGDHEDLWGIVWELLLTRPRGYVQICKVKAHQDLTSISDPNEHWKATMNQHADTYAKELVKKFCAGYTRKLQMHCKQMTTNRTMLKIFFHMWGEMNAKAMTLVKQTRPSRQGEMPTFVMQVDPQQLTPLQCDVDMVAVKGCLYGDKFLMRVIQYFSGLEWDFTQQQSVSLLELYADFTLTTKTLAPVLLTRASLGLPAGPKVYRLKDCNVVADMTFNDLQSQSRVWQRAIKWLLQHWAGCPWPTLCKTSSLSRLGYTVEQNGLVGRTMNRKWTVSTHVSTAGA